MSTQDDIAQKEAQVKDLPDQRWYQLARQRYAFVQEEKARAKSSTDPVTKKYADDICAVIDQGYSNLLDCILDVSK